MVEAFEVSVLLEQVELLGLFGRSASGKRSRSLGGQAQVVQETHIEDRFYDLGHDVIRRKDYQIRGSTDLAPYDLIVLTEFSPYVSTAGINNIEDSGKPVLVVAYWDFNYARKLGLTTTANCGYVGTRFVEAMTHEHPVTYFLGDQVEVYTTSYTVYGIDIDDVMPDVTPLVWSSASFEEVAVLVDDWAILPATSQHGAPPKLENLLFVPGTTVPPTQAELIECIDQSLWGNKDGTPEPSDQTKLRFNVSLWRPYKTLLVESTVREN